MAEHSTLHPLPLNHVEPFDMGTAIRRSKGKSALLVGQSALGGGAATLVASLFAFPHAMLVLPAVGVLTMVTTALIRFEVAFRENDQAAIDDFADRADRTVLKLFAAETGPTSLQGTQAFAEILAITTDVRPEVADVRRRAVASLEALRLSTAAAVRRLGNADTDTVYAQARVAAAAICHRATEDRAAIDRMLKDRDGAVAQPVVDAFSADVARIVSGTAQAGRDIPASQTSTGNAQTNRIVSAARKALEIDHDMTDDAGGRVDALIDRHLPHLLAVHGEASRHARLEDLPDLDRTLEEGVELIRRSVEEGLTRLRSAKASALADEIAFLRLRRGESGSLDRL